MADETTLRDRGALLLRQGDFAGASRELEAAVADVPGDERAWQYLGAARASLGDNKGSLVAFTRARDLAPQTAKNHYNVALAQQSTGANATARASLEKALALDPSYQAARDRLRELTTTSSAPDYATPTLRAPLAAPEFAPTPILGQEYRPTVDAMFTLAKNTSGMQGAVPAEAARGFNLGAATLPFFWLLNHQLKSFAYALFAVNSISRYAGRSNNMGILLAIAALQIGVFFFLGFKGNSIAWQNRRFDSVEDFRDCQRIWNYWGIPAFLVLVGINVLAFFVGDN